MRSPPPASDAENGSDRSVGLPSRGGVSWPVPFDVFSRAATALDDQSRKGAGLAATAYLLAFGFLVVTGRQREPWVLVASGVLLVLASVIAGAVARRIRSTGQWSPQVRLLVPTVLTVVALGLAVVFYLIRSIDGAALFCLCAAFIGIGHVVAELRSRSGRTKLRALLLVGCGAAVVGGLWLALVLPTWGLGIAAAGLLIGPIGLSLLSQDILGSTWMQERSPLEIAALALLGLAAVAIAVWLWLPAQGMPEFFGSRAAVVVMVLVLAMAANTQGDVLLVVVALALIWTGVPRVVDADDALLPSPATAEVVADDAPVLVALGDSYMSGEGAARFYAGTNDPGTNECRRAPTAYARQILDELSGVGYGDRLAFYACSGATGQDIIDRHQHPGEPPGGSMSQSQQLAALLDAGATAPLILVSIGGNDAGFSDIGTECLAPGNCVVRGQLWLDDLQDVAERVDAAYTAIQRVTKDEVPVLAVPYPAPVNPERCDYSLLESDEHTFLDGFVAELNRVVRKAATEHGFLYLGAMEQAMTDAALRICDGDPDELGVNFIALSDTEGLIDQLGNPKNWIHNSLHPNERGHDQMTRVLASWMHARRRVAPLPDESGSDVYQVRSLPQIMGEDRSLDYCGKRGSAVDGCELDSTGWALAETARFVLGIAAPAALLVLGAWLFALAVLRSIRRPARRLLDRWDARLFS